MSQSAGLSKFQLSYQISPIILNGGIADAVPGGMVPIISLLQPQDFSRGLLSQSDTTSFNDNVAHFSPMASGTLLENKVGEYPFANQRVAANAIIVQPLRISLMMIAPAPAEGGYPAKLAAFSSLQQTLAQHVTQGGTFTVATPAFLYTDLLLLALRDISGNESEQVQTRWQWDFYQPLLTAAAAQAAQNSLMSKISSQTQVSGDPPPYSGTANTVGQPASGIAPPLVPAATQLGGSGPNNLVSVGPSLQGSTNPAPSTSFSSGAFVPAGPNG